MLIIQIPETVYSRYLEENINGLPKSSNYKKIYSALIRIVDF